MNNHKLVILVLCIIIILLSVPACTSKGDSNLSSKLAFNVKRLIAAEKRGEAEEFAQSHGIELIDGSVKVTVECESGKAEDVAVDITNTGAKEVRVWRDWVSAIVLINKLEKIPHVTGVRLVRLPRKGVPQ